MLRFIRPVLLMFLAMAASVCAFRAAAQTLGPSALPAWDSTNQVLFFGHGVVPSGLVRGYAGGQQRGADINIPKDFPGVRGVIVESVTAGADDTTLISAILPYEGKNVRRAILTYGSSGRLLRTWDPDPQSANAIAYSKDDDAIFVLGDRNISRGSNRSSYPLLVEYDREGRELKSMVPADTLKDRGDSLSGGGETGEPVLKVTKDRIYIYAPTNREVVTCDRGGAVLATRSISDIVEKISTRDGYHLSQIHQVDFSDDGDVVLELLLGNDRGYALEVFRINPRSGDATLVHKGLDGTGLFFVGLQDGHYLYLENSHSLYIQADESLEPISVITAKNREDVY